MRNDFKFDVFLSHSSNDKAVVRPLAERLRHDRLKVWFDEWVLKPGDSIPAKIEEGLEHSCVLARPAVATARRSPRDQAVVRALAERLQEDGLKVWPVPPKRLCEGGFDEWVLKPGDDIPAKIDPREPQAPEESSTNQDQPLAPAANNQPTITTCSR